MIIAIEFACGVMERALSGHSTIFPDAETREPVLTREQRECGATASQIRFLPKLVKQSLEVKFVHMGVVLIATLAFGLITPPYGLVLLMASKFIGVRFSQALRAALPIYVVFLATITFAIYFPKIVLWLPKQVIPESVGCFKNPSGAGYICPK